MKKRLIFLWAAFAVVLFAVPAFSEDQKSEQPVKEEAAAPVPAPQPSSPAHPNKIAEVEIRGNQIVSTNTILSKLRTREGINLVQETVNDDLKRLYATNYFEDIRMELEEVKEGYKLVVEVVEKPVVHEIIFTGFSVFKEEKLRKEFKVLEGQILDEKAIKQGIEAIRKLYNGKGYRFVSVDSKMDINHQTKEAAVTVEINEGVKYKIKDVRFDGNKAFASKKLIRLMRTRKKGFPFHSGVFKEDLFQKDLEKVQLFYQQEGYLDVKVAPEFEYDKEGRWIFITVLIEEGKHYIAGDIKIEGNKLFPESEVWQELEMLPGQTYSQYYLSKDVEKIRTYYHHRGYMDARIIPDIRLNKENGKVDITYQIQEGDLYFVEKVIIRGNTKTKDIVIRRELRIRPGEKFDGEKIDKSKQRLENLGYFEDITYDTEPASASNRRDLIFRVKEKRTGELSFGGGVSSIDRFLAFGELAQKNFDITNWPRFTGGGQSVSLRARIGSISRDFNFSFVEPYVFNKPVTYGLDLYNNYRDIKAVDYNQNRLGVSNTVSKLFRDVFRVGSGYTLERVKLDEISDDAPETVRKFDGANWLSRLKTFTSWDTRDNVFNPGKGHLVTASGELIGTFLGGEQDYYILQTTGSQYWTFFKKHLLELQLKLGASNELGDSDEVPVFDRFYAGGLGSVRGYNYYRVSPIEAGNSVGGQTIAVANLEYTFPIWKLDAFRGAVFIDTGHVNSDSYNIDFGKFATSVGPGMKIKTPLGPLAFYYGYPIANKDTEDKNGRFEFSLSRGF